MGTLFSCPRVGSSKPEGLAKAVGERAERQHSVLSAVGGREANESIETSGERAPSAGSDD